ncbi:MAG: hypothetical protein ACSHXJ_02045 [Marinomonas colpomeniae]|uniref:Uncharacterized protein n=1 Tax=Marinomonas colpomeniae TaxID=2774408 RepID=A0ABR8NZF5_9GAMM|nr:hypothetical protein [Marinomonas colpomeniae]
MKTKIYTQKPSTQTLSEGALTCSKSKYRAIQNIFPISQNTLTLHTQPMENI